MKIKRHSRRSLNKFKHSMVKSQKLIKQSKTSFDDKKYKIKKKLKYFVLENFYFVLSILNFLEICSFLVESFISFGQFNFMVQKYSKPNHSEWMIQSFSEFKICVLRWKTKLQNWDWLVILWMNCSLKALCVQIRNSTQISLYYGTDQILSAVENS